MMAILVGILLIAAMVFVFGLLFSLPVMWLWNWLMPELFQFPEVTWMQSFGLLLLCGFLFKSGSASTSKG